MSNQTDYKITAFPCTSKWDENNNEYNGMTLLDYFAAQHIAQMTYRPKSFIDWVRWFLGKPYFSCISSHQDVARSSYIIASAMMEERKKYLTPKTETEQ